MNPNNLLDKITYISPEVQRSVALLRSRLRAGADSP